MEINGLKGQCHKILTIFFGLKDSTQVPYEQAKMVLRTFSFLQRYSIAKFKNLVSTQSTTMRTPKFFFRYGYWMVNTLKYLYCLIVPLKYVRSLQSFQKVSAQSLICPCHPKYLHENEKVCKIVFACSYGAQFESFKQKMVENLMTL